MTTDPAGRRPHAQYPERGRSSTAYTHKLEPGQLVIYDDCAHRVVETRPRALHDWPEDYAAPWRAAGSPDPATWYRRPIVITLRPEPPTAPGPDVHLLGPASHTWGLLPEHFSVCRLCLELPPCRHVHTERVMAEAVAKMDEAMLILPGCCHECREPVTHRQNAIRFPGANLIRPDLADGTAVFHARRSCWSGAYAYDERWAAAEPGRRRKMYCGGTRRHHYDGSAECTEGELCPGEVRHGGEEYHRPRNTGSKGCWCVTEGAMSEAELAATTLKESP